MTFDDLKKFYGSSYVFHRKTGMSRQTWMNWRKQGYIPIRSQIVLEGLTNGMLVADLAHSEMVLGNRKV